MPKYTPLPAPKVPEPVKVTLALPPPYFPINSKNFQSFLIMVTLHSDVGEVGRGLLEPGVGVAMLEQRWFWSIAYGGLPARLSREG